MKLQKIDILIWSFLSCFFIFFIACYLYYFTYPRIPSDMLQEIYEFSSPKARPDLSVDVTPIVSKYIQLGQDRNNVITFIKNKGIKEKETFYKKNKYYYIGTFCFSPKISSTLTSYNLDITLVFSYDKLIEVRAGYYVMFF